VGISEEDFIIRQLKAIVKMLVQSCKQAETYKIEAHKKKEDGDFQGSLTLFNEALEAAGKISPSQFETIPINLLSSMTFLGRPARESLEIADLVLEKGIAHQILGELDSARKAVKFLEIAHERLSTDSLNQEEQKFFELQQEATKLLKGKISS
jgi:hypothetical protein